jgi:hypothetical protein
MELQADVCITECYKPADGTNRIKVWGGNLFFFYLLRKLYIYYALQSTCCGSELLFLFDHFVCKNVKPVELKTNSSMHNALVITGESETLESVKSWNSRQKCTKHDMHRAAGQSNICCRTQCSWLKSFGYFCKMFFEQFVLNVVIIFVRRLVQKILSKLSGLNLRALCRVMMNYDIILWSLWSCITTTVSADGDIICVTQNNIY